VCMCVCMCECVRQCVYICLCGVCDVVHSFLFIRN